MKNTYVLNNLLDESLYLRDTNNETRVVNESKRFATRAMAEKFLIRNKLTRSYSVKLVSNKLLTLKESKDSSSVDKELSSVLDDTKDMIDTTLEYIQEYVNQSDPEMFNGSNIEDVLDRLRKLKKGAAGISFRPSFFDSDGSGLVPDLSKAEDPKTSDTTGGESHE